MSSIKRVNFFILMAIFLIIITLIILVLNSPYVTGNIITENNFIKQIHYPATIILLLVGSLLLISSNRTLKKGLVALLAAAIASGTFAAGAATGRAADRATVRLRDIEKQVKEEMGIPQNTKITENEDTYGGIFGGQLPEYSVETKDSINNYFTDKSGHLTRVLRVDKKTGRTTIFDIRKEKGGEAEELRRGYRQAKDYSQEVESEAKGK